MKDFMDDINSPAEPREPSLPDREEQPAETQIENGSVNRYGHEYDRKPTNFSPVHESTYDLPGQTEERSIMTDILKAVLGALIGAIPGMGLWILIGKTGYVASACGLLLAAGIVFGYTFMTKDNVIPLSWGVAICLVIMVSAVYFAERIVWTWEMVDAFKNIVPQTKDLYYSLTDTLYSYSDEDISSFVSDQYLDDQINTYLKSTFGFTEGTFSNCWNNFSKVIEATNSENDFHKDLFSSYIFAALGGGSLFYKFAKNK